MKTSSDDHKTGSCTRQEELVSYLYGEMNDAERITFERHLTGCAACRSDLAAFQSVRQELGSWVVPFAPRCEIVLQRSRLEVLRELLGLFPLWVRVVGAMAAAIVLVALAIVGLRLSPQQPQIVNVDASQLITRAEAETLIKAAVAQAQVQALEQAQAEARARLASLEAQLNAEYQIKLRAAVIQLRNEHRALLAQANQPTLREWLFAINDGRDISEVQNERNN
jgi:anti-sigma factor RsiW